MMTGWVRGKREREREDRVGRGEWNEAEVEGERGKHSARALPSPRLARASGKKERGGGDGGRRGKWLLAERRKR